MTVALANKAARVIWALLTRGEVYRAPQLQAPDRGLAASAAPKGRAKEVRDRQSDRLPRQTRCEGMRIEREIQMGASGGGQSIKASGHWPREQAGHKPATGMTVRSQKRLDPRRASTQFPSSGESLQTIGSAVVDQAAPRQAFRFGSRLEARKNARPMCIDAG